MHKNLNESLSTTDALIVKITATNSGEAEDIELYLFNKKEVTEEEVLALFQLYQQNYMVEYVNSQGKWETLTLNETFEEWVNRRGISCELLQSTSIEPDPINKGAYFIAC